MRKLGSALVLSMLVLVAACGSSSKSNAGSSGDSGGSTLSKADFIAQGIVLRGAGVADEVPFDDVTAQAVQQAYELPTAPDRTSILARAEAWRPYRMWATVLLHQQLRREGRPFRPAGRVRRR